MSSTEKEHTPLNAERRTANAEGAAHLQPSALIVQRSKEEHTPGPIQLDDLTIDLDNRRITRADGSRINLARQEQRLLGILLESRGSVLPYADLARSLWGKVDGVSSGALRRCALNLRHKLGTSHLQTIYGVGYRLTLNAECRTPNAECREKTTEC